MDSPAGGEVSSFPLEEEVSLHLFARFDGEQAPQVQQVIDDCESRLHRIGATVAVTEIFASGPTANEEAEQQIWLEALEAQRVRNQARYELTTREIEVLKLATQGLTNGQIGTHLFIALNTVKSHMQRIGTKMGTGDRTRIVGLFNGTVPPSNP